MRKRPGMDSLQHHVTPGSPTPLTQVLCVCVSHTVGLFLHLWYAHYACCSDSLLLSSVIANNGALPFVFDESSMLSLYLMCSQAGRARWLCTAPLSCNPPPQPPPPPHPTLCLSHAISPQAWSRKAPTIWGGLQIADSLWKSPVSPSTEIDLWTALLGPGVCICFTSCSDVRHDGHVAWGRKKIRLKTLAALKIKLILLTVLRKLCQSQLWFPWHAIALHMDESCRTYPLHACSGTLWLADWRKRS